MRSLIFSVAIFVLISAGLVSAQTPLPSIFAFPTSMGGTKADAAASSLEGQLFTDLFNKYQCMDMMDKLGLEGMIELERMRDLLGAKPDEGLLSQLGGAVGARYVIAVYASQLPNGTVYMQVIVVDSVTGKAVSRRDAPPADEKNINSTIASLKSQALADMANLLQGKCDEHWTGTITFKYRYDRSGPPENMVPPTTGNIQESKTDAMDVVLKPMSLGSTNPWYPGVKVTRHYEYHRLMKVETPEQVRCRPRGANSYLRPSRSAYSRKLDETGDATATRTLYVDIRSDGTFVITMNKQVELTTTWTREDIDQASGGCEDPPPTVATSKGSNTLPPRFLGTYGELRGTWDPKTPDILKGNTTEGNEKVGVTTITWNLRRVRPKGRNQK